MEDQPHTNSQQQPTDELSEKRAKQLQTMLQMNDLLRSSSQKCKLLVGVLSFFLPGLGHFYLGLMKRGLGIMLLFVMTVATIPCSVLSLRGDDSLPIVILLSCLIPVIIFYNMFDALQLADKVNAQMRLRQFSELPVEMGGAEAQDRLDHPGSLGPALVGAGIILFLLLNRPTWLEQLFHGNGAYLAAAILICAGIFLIWAEWRAK